MHQAVLAAEVEEHERVAQPRLRGDRTHGHTADPLARRHLERRPQDLLPPDLLRNRLPRHVAPDPRFCSTTPTNASHRSLTNGKYRVAFIYHLVNTGRTWGGSERQARSLARSPCSDRRTACHTATAASGSSARPGARKTRGDDAPRPRRPGPSSAHRWDPIRRARRTRSLFMPWLGRTATCSSSSLGGTWELERPTPRFDRLIEERGRGGGARDRVRRHGAGRVGQQPADLSAAGPEPLRGPHAGVQGRGVCRRASRGFWSSRGRCRSGILGSGRSSPPSRRGSASRAWVPGTRLSRSWPSPAR
jgi:hypothetical protein